MYVVLNLTQVVLYQHYFILQTCMDPSQLTLLKIFNLETSMTTRSVRVHNETFMKFSKKPVIFIPESHAHLKPCSDYLTYAASRPSQWKHQRTELFMSTGFKLMLNEGSQNLFSKTKFVIAFCLLRRNFRRLQWIHPKPNFTSNHHLNMSFIYLNTFSSTLLTRKQLFNTRHKKVDSS